MKDRIRLAVVLFAVVAVLTFGVALSAVPAASPAGLSAHPCSTNADCPPGLCCGSNGFCAHRSHCG